MPTKFVTNPRRPAASRAPTVATLSAKVVRLAKKHGADHPLTVAAREEFEVAAQAREAKRKGRMSVEGQMWAGMLEKRNPRAPSVTASVEQDDLSGGWSVYLHAGRRNVNITGDVFSSEAAAKREAKVLLALARAGVSLDTLVSNFYEAYHKPFRRAEHELANPRRHNPSDLKPGMRVGKYRVEEVRKRDIIVSYDRKKGDGRELYRVEGTTRADLEHAARTLDSVFFSSSGMPEHGYAGNPRRRNPSFKAPHPGPSVKRMVDFLRISKADAQALKAKMAAGDTVGSILDAADRILNGYGIEFISGVGGGLKYVNMGDTYNDTLIFDRKTNRFVVSSWGDIVERQPRRFAD